MQAQSERDALNSAIEALSDTMDRMGRSLAEAVEKEGKVDRSLLDLKQPQAFQYAHGLSELRALKALFDYACRLEQAYEWGLVRTYAAHCLQQMGCRVLLNPEAYGLQEAQLQQLTDCRELVETSLCSDYLHNLSEQLLSREVERGGKYGLDAEHVEMNQLFSRFADERIAPVAEEIHRHDRLIPESLLKELAELGVFGISIPEEYGGHFLDHLTMCIATEELSRASLGAGGSVITRPEICAKALLKGGTEEQKNYWLPRISSGETIVSIAVTEPNAGSDVASLRVSARPGVVMGESGYLINGEKTWCTFAGRADLLALLARTGSVGEGSRGLSLFLVEKPPFGAGPEEHHFTVEQEGGGGMEGHAIPTIGYRGMHSYTVTFSNYFVPATHRVGAEGEGFKLQMAGFAGGRIQTASRAVGLMEAAFRKAVSYTVDRVAFGRPLARFTLPQHRLLTMAARIQACRQLTYQVARQMDTGNGIMEASLVKLLSCKEAEWVTRESMQLHGGMGYSEEYDVSRYWQDARVLSIFEGAEEVLALYVVARQRLTQIISGK